MEEKVKAAFEAVKAFSEPLAAAIGAPWWVVPVGFVVVLAIIF